MTNIQQHNKFKVPGIGSNCLKVILLMMPIMTQFSCKKLVEIAAPSGSIAENNVYTTDQTAIAVLSGIYRSINTAPEHPFQGSFQGNKSFSVFTGLSSDELSLYSGVTDDIYLGYYRNTLSAVMPPVSGSEFWPLLYNYVFRCNAAIEGLNASSTLTLVIKQQLLGEAKFMRAFIYFYLVNMFGDVPLALTTDYKANALLSRVPEAQVYQQIIADLQEAESLLSSQYLDASLLKTTAERLRPNKWTAAALLARVYLYTGEYAKAEEQASSVINQSSLYNLVPLNNVFLKNSREAIWQIQPIAFDFNTEDARTFIIPATGPTDVIDGNPVYLSDHLLAAFEPNDQRAVYGNWIDTTIYETGSMALDTIAYPFKYKINTSPGVVSATDMTEYFMVLRLGEQLLIRAEARAQLNNTSGAQSDLNAIRSRAGLPSTTANDKSSLLAAVLHERQVELFTELGHRWFDLKRTGNVDAVMSLATPTKANGSPWRSYQQLYPLPQSDINTAPNLKQNPNY